MRKAVGKNVGKKPKRKTYDEEFKKLVVREYVSTNRASETARRYGIGRCTLLEWAKAYSTINSSNEIISRACVEAIEKTSDAVVRGIEANTLSRQEFIQAHYAELSEALRCNISAITTRLKNNPNDIPFRDLAASLTALTNVVKEFLPIEEQGTTQINLLQQTVNN